jgi:hypothetical protein
MVQLQDTIRPEHEENTWKQAFISKQQNQPQWNQWGVPRIESASAPTVQVAPFLPKPSTLSSS